MQCYCTSIKHSYNHFQSGISFQVLKLETVQWVLQIDLKRGNSQLHFQCGFSDFANSNLSFKAFWNEN